MHGCDRASLIGRLDTGTERPLPDRQTGSVQCRARDGNHATVRYRVFDFETNKCVMLNDWSQEATSVPKCVDSVQFATSNFPVVELVIPSSQTSRNLEPKAQKLIG